MRQSILHIESPDKTKRLNGANDNTYDNIAKLMGAKGNKNVQPNRQVLSRRITKREKP